MNIKHANKDNEPILATTDFMITIETEKGLEDVVRTVKTPSDLTPRTLELFQIEKTFFEEQGIDWGIILSTLKSIDGSSLTFYRFYSGT